MTRPELLDAIRRLADTPLEGFPRRRKGMDAQTAADILEAVLAEVWDVAYPVLCKDWNGSDVLDAVSALRGNALGRGSANGR